MAGVEDEHPTTGRQGVDGFFQPGNRHTGALRAIEVAVGGQQVEVAAAEGVDGQGAVAGDVEQEGVVTLQRGGGLFDGLLDGAGGGAVAPLDDMNLIESAQCGVAEHSTEISGIFGGVAEPLKLGILVLLHAQEQRNATGGVDGIEVCSRGLGDSGECR